MWTQRNSLGMLLIMSALHFKTEKVQKNVQMSIPEGDIIQQLQVQETNIRIFQNT